MDLYLTNKIETSTPINDITYTDEVPQDKYNMLFECLKGKNKIWGKNTDFTLNLDWNTELKNNSKRLPKISKEFYC